jgi:hypothetical protein
MPRIWLVALLVLASVLCAGCTHGKPCLALAAFRGVHLTVAADLAPTIKVLNLGLCQDGRCTSQALDLIPGSTTVPLNCDDGQYEPCSAQVTPDGTLIGSVSISDLSENAADVELTGTDSSGRALPVRTLNSKPVTVQPGGPDCGGGAPQLDLMLDRQGLRAGRVS